MSDLERWLRHPLIVGMSEVAEMKRRAFSLDEVMTAVLWRRQQGGYPVVTSSGRRTFNISYLRKSGESVIFQIEPSNPDTAVGLAVRQASINEGGFVDNLQFDDGAAQGLYKSLVASVGIARPEGHIDFIYPERH